VDVNRFKRAAPAAARRCLLIGAKADLMPQVLAALPAAARGAVMPRHEHEVQTIYGARIIGAKIRAESTRKHAAEAAREAVEVECHR